MKCTGLSESYIRYGNLYIRFGTMHITFWKKQNFSDRRQIHGGQGMRVEGETSSGRVGENFGG